MSFHHELFLSNNPVSLFLEFLSDYTKSQERGLIKILKIKDSSVNILKLPETPFLITTAGEILIGDIPLSETISKISGVYDTLYGRTQDEVFSHFDFMRFYKESAGNSGDSKNQLVFLNNHLSKNTFANGSHVTISDIYAYAHIIPLVVALPDDDKYIFCNVVRWVDHIQSLSGLKEIVRELRLRVTLPYEPLFLEASTNDNEKNIKDEKKAKAEAKRLAVEAFKSKGGVTSKDEKKEGGDKIITEVDTKITNDQKTETKTESKTETKTENKKVEKTNTQPKKGGAQNTAKPKDPLEDAHPVSKLDIRVGKVISCVVNTASEKLYNEEIDMGNGEIRKIASGLKGRVNIEDLQDSYVIVLANLKERTLCGWPSHGMILCASDEKGNIEPIRPAEGSQPGDLVTIGEYPRTPVAEINPKKSPWDVAGPEMMVNSTNVATYQGTSVWRTEKGEIRTKTVVNAKIS